MADIINQFAWEDLSVRVAGVELKSCTELKYTTEKEWVHVYGKGSAPQANQPGNESLSGTLGILRSDLEVLRQLSPGGNITLLRGVIITAKYENADAGRISLVLDTLSGVNFTSNEIGLAQGDTHENLSIPFTFLRLTRIPPSVPA